MSGHIAESVEPDVRCGSYSDQYTKVGLDLHQWWVMRHLRVWGVDRDICSLLNDPNTSSPANVEASNLYKDNRREYTKRVRDIVERSWED